jgi:hypothetical protein
MSGKWKGWQNIKIKNDYSEKVQYVTNINIYKNIKIATI